MAQREIEFEKAHGLGNDFLVVKTETLPSIQETELSRLAIAMCDRHRGVGADGVVFVFQGTEYPQLDLSVRIFNSDGSEAEMSGNGIRCAAAVHCAARPTIAREIAMGTIVGRRTLRLLKHEGIQFRFSADMGIPTFAAESIPFVSSGLQEGRGIPQGVEVLGVPLQVEEQMFEITAMNVGNPQCIVFTKDFDSFDWKRYGRKIEIHPRFPEKTNVEFVRCLDQHSIEIRIWERGAGHTHSSGTGSIASALGAILNDLATSPVRVISEGGELEVEWKGFGESVFLTGDAEIVCHGVFHLDQGADLTVYQHPR